jgi:hypothetical protein
VKVQIEQLNQPIITQAATMAECKGSITESIADGEGLIGTK